MLLADPVVTEMMDDGAAVVVLAESMDDALALDAFVDTKVLGTRWLH